MDWTILYSSIYGIASGIVEFVSTYESVKLSTERQKLFSLYSHIFSFILLTCSFLFILLKSLGFSETGIGGLLLIISYIVLFMYLLRSYEFDYDGKTLRLYLKLNSKIWIAFKYLLLPPTIIPFISFFPFGFIGIPTLIVLIIEVILFWILFYFIQKTIKALGIVNYSRIENTK